MYEITEYSKKRAKELGVQIRPSASKGKKIDVYKKDKKVASIGSAGYKDFPTYLKQEGKEYAESRRKQYKIRHEKDRKVKGTAGYYADQILW